MSCVTPADLGKPIAAIVERCGPPGSVVSLSTENELLYADGGRGVSITFDADQMRARILQFFTMPPAPAQPFADWTVTLPFESGARQIALGHMTVADAQSTLAADADVTTQYGAAFHSTDRNDVVLASSTDDHVLRAAFVGERASLMQSGIIASPLDDAPLDYMSPIPRDTWLKADGTGSRTTIFRIDVDATGIVRNVTIVVASGDAAFDASALQRLGDAKFRPATLDKRPVSGTSFVQVRH
jgi:TonB family protein